MGIEYGAGISLIIFTIFALLVGSLTRYCLKGTRIPYTVALLIIGLGIGLIEKYTPIGQNLQITGSLLELVNNADPHLILFLFLPTLIFQSAFSLEHHLFKRMYSQIMVLAIPALLVSTFLTAAFVKGIFPFSWHWPMALMFGALISATDPVAVVAVLHEVSSRKRLETLIEGESLLNDGTAIVLFVLFIGMVTSVGGAGFSISATIIEFIWVVAGGIIVGILMGLFALGWVNKVFNDPLIEITVSIVATYMTYFVAEFIFHVSPVVAVVALGVIFASIGKTRISTEVSDFLSNFWGMMSYIANTIIFLLVGLLIAFRVEFGRLELWIALVGLYLGLNVIRAVAIGIFLPILAKIGIGISRRKAIVMIWGGGLRGAVSLAMALSVARIPGISEEVINQILFLCAGIVFLTVIINGSSIGAVLKWVGFDKLPPGKAVTVARAKTSILAEFKQLIETLKKDEHLKMADWQKVTKFVHLDRAEEFSEEIDKKNEPTEKDLELFFRRRIFEIERRNYWEQYKNGMLEGEVVNALVKAVELCLDFDDPIGPRKYLQKHFMETSYPKILMRLPIIKNLLEKLFRRRLLNSYDIAWGFLRAQQSIAKNLNSFAPSKEIEIRVREEIEINKRDAYSWVSKLRERFPDLATKLETREAASIALNLEREIINRLHETAVLDGPEAEKMIEKVEEYMFEQKTQRV